MPSQGTLNCLDLSIGLDWFGLVWIGLDWFGLDWIGLDLNSWFLKANGKRDNLHTTKPPIWFQTPNWKDSAGVPERFLMAIFWFHGWQEAEPYLLLLLGCVKRRLGI